MSFMKAKDAPAPVAKCVHCDRVLTTQNDWIVDAVHGRPIAFYCPEHQSPEHRADALMREAVDGQARLAMPGTDDYDRAIVGAVAKIADDVFFEWLQDVADGSQDGEHFNPSALADKALDRIVQTLGPMKGEDTLRELLARCILETSERELKKVRGGS